MIYWFTGQPGAGKTTLAKYLMEYFPKDNVIHVDGDYLRDAFNDKDYSEFGRRKHTKSTIHFTIFT